jgi:hypothetical protein
VLRRGKPAEEAADAETGPEKSAAKPPGATAKSATLRYLPAISDADGPEPRPYFFAPKAGEEAEFRSQVMKMAQNAVAGYEKPRRPTFASAQITPQQFRIFDLDYSNQPVMVLTASAKITDRVTRRRAATADGKPEPAPELMVTVVARQDIYGELQPLFSSVTDRQHLDEFPRLELIDAVDADGDGRGELLFRETSDSGIGWAIYKPGPDKLARIFDTFAPED